LDDKTLPVVNGAGEVIGDPWATDENWGNPMLYQAGTAPSPLTLHEDAGAAVQGWLDGVGNQTYFLSSGGDVLWSGRVGSANKNRVKLVGGSSEEVPIPLSTAFTLGRVHGLPTGSPPGRLTNLAHRGTMLRVLPGFSKKR